MTLGLPGIDAPPPDGARREADFYPTPANLIRPFEAVLRERVEALPGLPIVEPACGDGRLLRHLAALAPGRQLVGLDIRREAVEATRSAGFEAHQADWTAVEVDEVLDAVVPGPRIFVTNPPFSLALPFARDGLRRAGASGMVALLLRVSWFEPTIERADWLPAHACDVWWPPARGQFKGGGTDNAATVWAIWPRRDGGTDGNVHRYLGRQQ